MFILFLVLYNSTVGVSYCKQETGILFHVLVMYVYCRHIMASGWIFYFLFVSLLQFLPCHDNMCSIY